MPLFSITIREGRSHFQVKHKKIINKKYVKINYKIYIIHIEYKYKYIFSKLKADAGRTVLSGHAMCTPSFPDGRRCRDMRCTPRVFRHPAQGSGSVGVGGGGAVGWEGLSLRPPFPCSSSGRSLAFRFLSIWGCFNSGSLFLYS